VTPRIEVDFQNADTAGRLRLNTEGSRRDLARLGIELTEGLGLILSDGELEAHGIVVWSADEGSWVAQIDWQAVREVDP
jgi:hypothetical protein